VDDPNIPGDVEFLPTDCDLSRSSLEWAALLHQESQIKELFCDPTWEFPAMEILFDTRVSLCLRPLMDVDFWWVVFADGKKIGSRGA
jgi:hypothetical protein